MSTVNGVDDGLSAEAIGGIVGGILAALFLVGMGALFCFLGCNRRLSNHWDKQRAAGKQVAGGVMASGNLSARKSPVDIDVGGRLRYPNEDVDGGRLGSSV
jgi:hypothetical protein